MRRSGRRSLAAVSAGVLCLTLAVPGTSWADEHGVRTVATGFAGPLNVSVAPNGRLYVADAFAGQIVQVDPTKGRTTPLVSGLEFSPAVDVHGGQVFFTAITEPTGPDDLGSAVLMRTNPGGTARPVADLLQFELDENPDDQPQTPTDTLVNPYAVVALPGRTIVADAAGNALVEVKANGDTRLLTVFPVSFEGECAELENNGVPNGGCDAVPTGVDLGPDGYLYVSGLGAEVEGFVWKVDARTGEIVETLDGFPPLTGIAVGDDGSVYASSLFAGMIFRIAPDGSMSVAEVPGPTGMEFDRGVLYVGSLDFGGGPGSVLAVSPSAFSPL
jgi:sugar lactone lactonase YvrE